MDAVALFAEKNAVIRRLRAGQSKKREVDTFTTRLAAFRNAYADVWLQRNKPHRLADVTHALDDLIADLPRTTT